MKRLPKIDRLLRELSENIFVRLSGEILLQFRRAQPDELIDEVDCFVDWQSVHPDLVWGEPESYFWFAGDVVVPDEAAGRRLVFFVDAAFGDTMGRSDPQCLVRIDGRIVQAVDGNHRYVLLSPSAHPGDHYRITIEAGTIEDRRQLGFKLGLAIHDQAAEALYFDLKVPVDVARLLKPDDARALAILNHAEAALLALDLRPGNPARFCDSLAAAASEADRIYALAGDPAMPTIVAAGHTHIDVAWLWRTRETRRKMSRSMATALALLDEYPDYRFMYNQCLLFDWLAEDHPALMARIQDKVKAGQFEIEGALWLEPDVNLVSGESLVRQIVRGVRYHEATFGIRPRLLWLPDTFGYGASLPQLMKLSGVETFVTHKLSWNDTNRMPFDTFFWQGIDGSKVPASFVTTQTYEYDGFETTYCANLRASHVLGTWKRHAGKARQSELFMIYGHGDGGGGPTREMVETIRRFERGIPGAPRVKQSALGPYFHDLAERMVREPGSFPTWVGELYFECHRGTLTSVGKVKRDNRRAEIRLREIELLAVLAMRAGVRYPADEIDQLWRIVLLNQFHDILPGSSVGGVYDDADIDFAAFTALADDLEARLAAVFSGGSLILNASHRPRGGLLTGPQRPGAQLIHRADGTSEWLLPVAAIAGNSVGVGRPSEGTVTDAPAAKADLLENALLRVRFDDKGRITSLFDKRSNRELIPAGEVANRIVAHQDIPVEFDAWNIDAHFEDKTWEVDHLVRAEVVETGPYRAAIRFEWRYEASRIIEVVSLATRSDRVELDVFIDWHEHKTLLKLAVPVNVAADESRAEVHFGHVRRPTHANTSWDQARFETLMHRWVDLSDGDAGLAVLNDCKYGYDARGNRLRITLLKSPVYPWPDADQGEHRFRLALMPHRGFAVDGGRIVEASEDFNMPLRWLGRMDQPGAPADVEPPFTIQGDGIEIAAVKKAENDNGIVVRLYETRGRRAEMVLTTPLASAAAVDLLERDPTALPVIGGRLTLAFQPFEIKTLKLGA
ncbi:alpha-mannosidase [Pleomorphomonas oryzae]|uniref:alpha-mannosidase n=1 Tax=Pleomorphomonas oryzae TaxID=261934 RepID=UPI00041029A1|nr:glycoside hydrolase family 38 C-terminal domain-containing protein [Pleomorphomonas oryzae]